MRSSMVWSSTGHVMVTSRTARDTRTWISMSVEEPGVGEGSSPAAHAEMAVSSVSIMRGEMYFSVKFTTPVTICRFVLVINHALTREGVYNKER